MNAAQKNQVVCMDPEKALEDLKWLGLAISTDDTRFALCRLFVDAKMAVATDGHRMHFIEGSCLPAGFSIRGSEVSLILDMAKRFSLRALEFRGTSTHWRFESADGVCELTLNIVDFTFPNYERVIPVADEPTELTTKDARKVYVGTESKPDYCALGKGHFNARYVAEALRGAPKSVTAFVGADEHAPVLFRYLNRGAVVMPVRQ